MGYGVAETILKNSTALQCATDVGPTDIAVKRALRTVTRSCHAPHSDGYKCVFAPHVLGKRTAKAERRPPEA